MKILLISANFNGGGAEHVARIHAELFCEVPKVDLQVLTCNPIQAIQIANEKVKVVQVGTGLLGKINLLFGSGSLYRDYTEVLKTFKPDIIHLHNFISFSPSLFQSIQDYKKRTEVQVVFTHHTYSYLCTNDSLYNFSQKAICEKCIGSFDTHIMRFNCCGSIMKSVAKFIQKKRFQKAGLKKIIDVHISPSFFLKEKLVQVFPEMCVRHVWNPAIENNIAIDSKIKRENKIVYFGRISKEKNIVEFVKIFNKTKHAIKFLIIGDGPSSRDIMRLATQDDRITFIPYFLPTEDLKKMVSTAKYFVLPSIWYENSPVAIVEAIRWGLVPIVSNLGGMKELVNWFNFGYTINLDDFEKLNQLFDNFESNFNINMLRWPQALRKLSGFTKSEYLKNILLLYDEITNKP